MTPPVEPAKETSVVDVAEADGYYKVYEEYAKALRTWLVAYGIGGPVLLLTNDAVRETFAKSEASRAITIAFLLGVAVQIGMTAVNKTVMWAQYYSELTPEVRDDWLFRSTAWLSGQFWIDFLADVISMAVFVWATWQAFDLLV